MKKIFLLILIFVCGQFIFAAEVFKGNAEASYYADKFHGRMTANGEIFDMYAFTCAHKTLPFNTVLRVTNLSNGKIVQVRVNDRGPFVAGREIDLSKGAAIKLDMIKSGTARVKIEILKEGDGKRVSATGSGTTKKSVTTKSVAVESGRTSDSVNISMKQIQLGSYADKNYGRNFAEKVSRAGFKSVYLVKAGDVYRVMIKNVKSDDVDEMLKRLDKAGFTAHLVKEQK